MAPAPCKAGSQPLQAVRMFCWSWKISLGIAPLSLKVMLSEQDRNGVNQHQLPPAQLLDHDQGRISRKSWAVLRQTCASTACAEMPRCSPKSIPDPKAVSPGAGHEPRQSVGSALRGCRPRILMVSPRAMFRQTGLSFILQVYWSIINLPGQTPSGERIRF